MKPSFGNRISIRRAACTALLIALAQPSSACAKEPETGSSAAQDDAATARDAARALATEGVRHARIGNVGRAAELFEQAYALFPSPTIAYRWGLALEQGYRLDDARRAYRLALRPAPAGVDIDAADEAQRAAEERLKKLESVHGPVGAVDQPAPALLPSPGAAGTMPSSLDGTAPMVTTPSATERVEPDEGSSAHPAWLAVAVGSYALSGAGMAIGVTSGVLSVERYADVESGCAGSRCPSSVSDALEEARTFEAVSTAGYVLQAAGAVVGTAALTLALTSDDGPAELAYVGVGIAPGSLSIGGAF